MNRRVIVASHVLVTRQHVFRVSAYAVLLIISVLYVCTCTMLIDSFIISLVRQDRYIPPTFTLPMVLMTPHDDLLSFVNASIVHRNNIRSMFLSTLTVLPSLIYSFVSYVLFFILLTICLVHALQLYLVLRPHTLNTYKSRSYHSSPLCFDVSFHQSDIVQRFIKHSPHSMHRYLLI